MTPDLKKVQVALDTLQYVVSPNLRKQAEDVIAAYLSK